MKKKIVVALALALCIAIALPVAALASNFVPSITYKGGPEVDDAQMIDSNGVVVEGMENAGGSAFTSSWKAAK